MEICLRDFSVLKTESKPDRSNRRFLSIRMGYKFLTFCPLLSRLFENLDAPFYDKILWLQWE